MSHVEIFADVINMYLPEPQASLLNGIIFGLPLKTSASFYQQLKNVGLLHIVVLSGMNITLLSSIVLQSISFLNKRIALMIDLGIIILFIWFVGVQAPVIRAAIMAILTIVSTLYGRKTMAMYILFLAAIITLVIWPQWLTTVSFQLSYAASLGLILFAPKELSEKDQKEGNVLFLYIKKEFQISLAAQVFTAPLIFLYFKQISFISPVSNILISWLIAPVMIIGFLTAFLGKINHLLGIIPAYICYGLMSYMVIIIDFCYHIPFSSVTWK